MIIHVFTCIQYAIIFARHVPDTGVLIAYCEVAVNSIRSLKRSGTLMNVNSVGLYYILHETAFTFTRIKLKYAYCRKYIKYIVMLSI
jgi:hypothetical protein